MTTPAELPVGACGDTAPTGDHLDQYLYTSHAHLELVCLAIKSGHQWQIERALDAAQRHLDHYKERP